MKWQVLSKDKEIMDHTSHNFQLNYGTGKFLTNDVADIKVYAILRGNLIT